MKEKILRRMLPAIVAFTLIVSIGMNGVPLQSVYAASSSSGTWIKESNGRWWYKHKDGSYTKYDWEYIDGSWYFFDSSGWMWTEWLEWEGDWYYLNPSGVMHTGWLKDDGKWYYFTSRGVMVKRWVQIDGYWYYFEPADGSMRTDSFTYDYRTYYFYSSGKLRSTELSIEREPQILDHWCWVASSIMVGTYYTNNNVSQNQVVNFVKGKFVNEGGTPEEEIWAIYFASNYTKSCERILWSDIKYQDMVSYIDKNHPFLMNLEFKNGYYHAVVGAGYDMEGDKIWVINPAGHIDSQYYKFADLMLQAQFGSQTGYCYDMLAY